MMNIAIRKATEEDVQQIQKFGAALAEYESKYDSRLNPGWALTDDGKQKYLKSIKEGYVTIAEVDGKPAGYLIGKIQQNKSGARSISEAYLSNIYVAEVFRNNKVGEKLALDFKEYCKANDVDRLHVTVIAENHTAIKFYQKVGFSLRSLNLYEEL